MSYELGPWAFIDIETTGIDANYDQIIDLGFLSFEGTKLVKKYSSLCKADVKLSHFITALTGISQSMVNSAPAWSKLEPELIELQGIPLIAHNAGFEDKFLSKYFENNRFDEDDEQTVFHDSLYFFGLLFPDRNSLSLESIIVDFALAEGEVHRGYEDSRDLLKTVLFACYLYYQDRRYAIFRPIVEGLIVERNLKEEFVFSFFLLSESQLHDIAQAVEFDLRSQLDLFLAKNRDESVEEKDDFKSSCSYEFSGPNVARIFEDEQAIAQRLPGYKKREAQKQLALRVGQSFKNNLHSMVQAPTGTGKTLGYLIPAILHNRESEESILVSTGTKALQTQIMDKDIPLAKKMMALGLKELKAVELVGSSNHYCELLFRNMESESLPMELDSFDENFTAAFFDLLFTMSAERPWNNKIRRLDVPYILKNIVADFASYEKQLAVDFRACTGSKCPFHSVCSYKVALKEAQNADIIVGNHALMLNWPSSLPRPTYVVVDEAHKMEQEGTQAFKFEVGQGDLRSLLKNLQTGNGFSAIYYLLEKSSDDGSVSTIRTRLIESYEKILDYYNPLDKSVEQYFKKLPRYTDIYWNEKPMIRKDSLKDALSTGIYNSLEAMHLLLKDVAEFLNPYFERFELNSLDDDNSVIAYTKFEKVFSQLEDIVIAIGVALEGDEKYAHVIRFHEEYGHALESSPIDIGKRINDNLLNPSRSVVMTSATLANVDGARGAVSMEWTTGHSYLDSKRRFQKGLYLPPVFNYGENARVFLCDDTPYFGSNTFVEEVLAPVSNVIRKLGGRTLLLFSSRVRFEKAREILLRDFEGEIPLFIQGMGSQLIEEFKRSANGILLGMESLGEGIDIPGKSLEFLFIDKIPDMRMELINNKRREEFERLFGNEFNDYFMPHRTRSLQQKLGRLLRSESDRGAAIVVDSRAKKWKGSTMNRFKELMRPYNIEGTGIDEACSEITSFLL